MAFFGRRPKKPQQLGRIEGGRTKSGAAGREEPAGTRVPVERRQRAGRNLRNARAERSAR